MKHRETTIYFRISIHFSIFGINEKSTKTASTFLHGGKLRMVVLQVQTTSSSCQGVQGGTFWASIFRFLDWIGNFWKHLGPLKPLNKSIFCRCLDPVRSFLFNSQRILSFTHPLGRIGKVHPRHVHNERTWQGANGRGQYVLCGSVGLWVLEALFQTLGCVVTWYVMVNVWVLNWMRFILINIWPWWWWRSWTTKIMKDRCIIWLQVRDVWFIQSLFLLGTCMLYGNMAVSWNVGPVFNML